MPVWIPNLLNILARGNFPLKDEGGLALWNNLVEMLEHDPDQTLLDIKKAMTDLKRFTFQDVYSNQIEVNSVDVDTGQSDLECLLGEIHTRLTDDHGIAIRPRVQSIIQRVRVLLSDTVEESSIIIGLDTNLGMGNGLKAKRLTCIPDSSLGVTFGSVPDQSAIGISAPAWNKLKKRGYESPTGTRGAKPHYVLAHLLNHNVNGPGNNPRNVVPFWAAANTQMASQAEVYVKQLVNRGCEVQYMITFGADVGMTTGRQAALGNCSTQLQREIVELEQHLPAYLLISIKFVDPSGTVQEILAPHRIDNFVPETVPLIR